MDDKITIIIPSKNEEETIENLLEEIYDQRIGETRIILADAHSLDKTRLLANKKSKFLELNLEIIDGGTPAEGRNRGANIATTKWVLFIDADVTFTKEFNLRDCIDSIEIGGYEMFSSTPVYRGNLNIIASALFFLNKISTIIISKKEPFAIGAFTLIDREKFKKIGGYDESLKHTEDWIMSKKIDPDKFLLVPDLITQDDRRFKKFGYIKTIISFLKNWVYRNNIEHFQTEIGYWDHYKSKK